MTLLEFNCRARLAPVRGAANFSILVLPRLRGLAGGRVCGFLWTPGPALKVKTVQFMLDHAIELLGCAVHGAISRLMGARDWAGRLACRRIITAALLDLVPELAIVGTVSAPTLPTRGKDGRGQDGRQGRRNHEGFQHDHSPASWWRVARCGNR